MKIDQKLVHHVAGLANLELTESDARYYETQLTKILDYVAVLETMSDDLGSDWRPDVQGPATPEAKDHFRSPLTPEEALAAAPQRVGTAFQVPRIID